MTASQGQWSVLLHSLVQHKMISTILMPCPRWSLDTRPALKVPFYQNPYLRAFSLHREREVMGGFWSTITFACHFKNGIALALTWMFPPASNQPHATNNIYKVSRHQGIQKCKIIWQTCQKYKFWRGRFCCLLDLFQVISHVHCRAPVHVASTASFSQLTQVILEQAYV